MQVQRQTETWEEEEVVAEVEATKGMIETMISNMMTQLLIVINLFKLMF